MMHDLTRVFDNSLQKIYRIYSINFSRITGAIVVSAIMFVFPLCSVLASPPPCMDGIISLQAELDKHFSDPNDPGLHERRNRLRKLFERQTPTCAKKIRKWIDNPSSGGLAEQFQRKLATPTRVELLAVLDKRVLATPKVDITGEIEITTGPTDRQIVGATHRAKGILDAVDLHDVSVDDAQRLRRMKCVVRIMIAEGPSIDDAYYPVAPVGVPMDQENPLICSKRKKDSKVQCRETIQDVIDSCQTSFSEKLVTKAAIGDDNEVLQFLFNIDSEIARGLAYFALLHGMGKTKGHPKAWFCPSEVVLFDNMRAKVHRDVSIYNCYTDIKLGSR